MTARSKGAALLAASRLPSRVEEVPGLGTVELRGFTARQRAEFVARGREITEKADRLREIQPWVVIQGAHDPETGQPLFGPEDAEALLDSDAAIIDQMSEGILKLSGLAKDAKEEAGKGSAPTATGASSSDSLSPSEAAPSPSSSAPSEAMSSRSGRSSPSSNRSAPEGKSTAPVRSSPPS